jgi:hypothetical protein
MARHVRDPKLDTRSSRSKLLQRREPYWRAIAGGLSIGYRKGANGGTWIARHYSTGHGRQYRSIGAADDVADADSVHVLSFDQAQDIARKWLGDLAQGRGAQLGPYTVSNAADDYLAHLQTDGRGDHAVADARSRVEAFIRPALGKLDLAAPQTSCATGAIASRRRPPGCGHRRDAPKSTAALLTRTGDGQGELPRIGHGRSCARSSITPSIMTRSNQTLLGGA